MSETSEAASAVNHARARGASAPRFWRSDAQLRRGAPIADVALDAGLADQAHLQRTFKRLVAATPGQYRC